MIGGNFTINKQLVEPSLGRLSARGRTVHLEPQVMKVLSYLAARPCEVVTKEQLIDALWGDTIVGDAALARCISQIRRALGDNPRKPAYIETIPKIGYRLIAEVGSPPAERARMPAYRWVAAAAVLLVLGSVAQSVGTKQDSHAPELISPAMDHYVEGRRLYDKFTYPHNQNAIVMFEQALAHDDGFGLAYAGLADAHVQQAWFWGGERLDEALALAGTAVDMEPNRAESHTALGSALALNGDVDGALAAFDRALQIDPGSARAAFESANLYFRRLQFDEAERLYLAALSEAPDHDVAMSNLGYLYLKTGNVDAARTWLTRVLQRLPLQAQAASRLAMVDMFTGHPSDAEARCRRIKEAFPDHYACLQVIAVASLMNGDLPNALEGFQNVVAKFPDDRYARLGQALILLAEAHETEAMRLIDDVYTNTLKTIDEGAAESYDYWIAAGCNTLRGNPEAAYEWFDRAAAAGRRFSLWDAHDPLFASLRGDSRFDRYIAATQVTSP